MFACHSSQCPHVASKKCHYIRAGDNAVLGASCRPDCIFIVSNGQLRTFDERLRTRWIRSGPKKRKRRGDVDVVEIHDDLDDLIATGV